MATEGPIPTPDDDASLMLAVRAGDERAFATLVRRWQGRIVSLAHRYLGSAADAEDLAQEVFLRVHRARESYEPTARFSTWIYRIAVNASLNSLRARKVRRATGAEGGPDPSEGPREEPADDAAPDPADALERTETARVLRELVDALPERQRIAILLNKYEGLSYEEVAASMDLTVSAVKSLLTRARVSLRAGLEPYLAAGEERSGGSGRTGSGERDR